MASHAAKVKADIVRWRQAGLIDQPTADLLACDIEAHERASFSFGSILAVLAALLMGAALLLFVGANWESIPRPARVGLLFCVIAVGYIGGAALKITGRESVAEAVWLVAAAAFGGALALVGQMYHLSGETAAALLTWFCATLLAAFMLRSSLLTVAAGGLAAAWLCFEGVSLWSLAPHLWQLPVMLAAVWAVSWWTRSMAARHLALLVLIFYGVVLALEFEAAPIGMALAGVSALAFLAAVLAPREVERLAGLGGYLPLSSLLGFLTGMTVLQAEFWERTGPLALLALVALLGIVVAIMLAGRESRAVRVLAYLGFAEQLCLVYLGLIGTMLNTAALLFIAALLMAALAFVIFRVERRMDGRVVAGVPS